MILALLLSTGLACEQLETSRLRDVHRRLEQQHCRLTNLIRPAPRRGECGGYSAAPARPVREAPCIEKRADARVCRCSRYFSPPPLFRAPQNSNLLYILKETGKQK